MTYFEVLLMLSSEYEDRDAQALFIIAAKKLPESYIRKKVFDSTGLLLVNKNGACSLASGYTERQALVSDAWRNLILNQKQTVIC